MIKRVQKEYTSIQNNPIEGVQVQLENQSDISVWILVIEGPKGSPYYGGKFKFRMTFPQDFPFKYPKVDLLTSIFHIWLYRNPGGNCICCCMIPEITSNWSPAISVSNVLINLKSMFFYDKYINQFGKNVEEYKLLTTDKQLYQQKLNEVMAEEYTKDYILAYVTFRKHIYNIFPFNPDLIFIDIHF